MYQQTAEKALYGAIDEILEACELEARRLGWDGEWEAQASDVDCVIYELRDRFGDEDVESALCERGLISSCHKCVGTRGHCGC